MPSEIAIPSMQPLNTGGATGIPMRAGMLAPPPGAAHAPRPPPPPMMQPAAVGSAPVDVMGLGRGSGPVPQFTDEELRQHSDAAIAALGPAPAAQAGPGPGLPGPQAALEGAYGGNLTQWMANEQALGRMQPRTVSRANPMAPIVQRRGGEQLAREGEAAPFAPPDFVAPERDATESDAAYAMRVDLGQEKHQADTAIARLDYDQAIPAARDVGQGGNIGELEAERRIGERGTEAQMQQAEAMATAEATAAGAQREAISEARQLELDRRDFRDQQRDAVTRLQDVEKQARSKLEAMPALTQKRRMEDMGLGQKILAVMGAMAGGAIGRDEMNPMLEREVQRDLEVQKLNHQIGVRNYEATSDAVGMGLDVYRNLLEGLGDEQAADQVYTNMMMEDGVALIREEAARTEIPVVRAELEQQALMMEQNIRARRDATQLQVETTPNRIASTVDPFRHERKRLESRQERIESHMDKLELKGVDVAEKRAGREQAVTIEGMKQEGAATKAAATTKAKSDMEIKKASDEWGAVETLIGDFLERNPDNIHGVGAPLTGDQSDRIRTRQFKIALELLATSGFTGATSTERQAEQIKSMVEGDLFELTDDAFRTRMGSMLDTASSRRRFYEKQLGSSDPRIQDPSELSTFQPR